MRSSLGFASGLAMSFHAALLLSVPPAYAKVSAEEAGKLGGPDLTCFGAEKKGTTTGIPQWSGKWIGKWPGSTEAKGYQPGPYAAEKPAFVITAENAEKYAQNLTQGSKALLKRYPKNYKMLVYPSHRDFSPPEWTCDVARKNAVTSEFVDDFRGVTGLGGAPAFPLPKTGLEAVWAAKTTYRPWTERCICDIADVYGNGTIGWGRIKFLSMNNMNIPDASKRPSLTEKINTYFYQGYQKPDRNKGEVAVGFQPNNYAKDSTTAWQYLPGTRRVRQAPEIGYDYPIPPAGLHATDEDNGFNGSTERYTWKLVGKKEIFVPYNNFRINDPSLKYSELLTPNTINPDHVRYELHRVYVVEANLIDGFRHQYKKRQLYIDEDSLQILWSDNYDARGELWRIAMITYYYSAAASSYHRGVQVFHDLIAGVYEAANLVNERGDDGWQVNAPMSPGMFTPEAASRAGR